MTWERSGEFLINHNWMIHDNWGDLAYNPIEIAKLEFKKGIIPITVKRPLPASK